LIVAALGLTVSSLAVAQAPPGIAEGWSGEFDHAARQITQLAEAIPADKYGWRPAPGVRSVSEVIMHLSIANYFLLAQTGAKPPVDLTKLGKEPDKGITAKDEVLKFLKASLDFVRTTAPTIDRTKTLKLFGKDVTADGVLLRVLVHTHEHMGQLIAYARVNGVTPPWSGGNSSRGSSVQEVQAFNAVQEFLFNLERTEPWYVEARAMNP
jgi:uncharacterized damage-inducible protein DinB